MAIISLANYRIPKDPSAIQRHVFTSNASDDKELWHKAFGMRTLLESVAIYSGQPLGHNQLRKYTRDPRVLLEWITAATPADFSALRSALSRMPWGVMVYNYLWTCWLVHKTKYQSTLVCRLGKNTQALTARQQVNALYEHLQVLRKFAEANHFSILWAFDHDELPPKAARKKRVNTFHVHIYCTHKNLFTFCREEVNLLPFVPRHTVLSATVPVRLPRLRGDGMIDWIYHAPGGADTPFTQLVPNTLAYTAAKTSGLHMRQSKPNAEGGISTVTHTNKTARYVTRVVGASDPKGKPRKHWGYQGFGIKGSRHDLV